MTLDLRAAGRTALACVTAWTFSACSTQSAEARAHVEKELSCSACHQPNGRTATTRSPLLAGQTRGYLVAQLKAFRDHSRADADGRFYMWPMVASLSDSSIDLLADHFASQQPPVGTPGTNTASDGKTLFDRGAPDRGVAPCSSCHGDKGQGVADFPRLAGQHGDYLNAQLLAFADGSRPNPIMGPLAKNLSADEMRSVAAYLQSL